MAIVDVDFYKEFKDAKNPKSGLKPSQELPYEHIPKDSKGEPLIIIGRVLINFLGVRVVDVYNDTENHRGKIVVFSDGGIASADMVTYAKLVENFERWVNKVKEDSVLQ